MERRHKDLLRAVVAGLRRTLAGGVNHDGTWVRGDLDRELERLGVALDGRIAPADALHNPSPADLHARRVAEAELASLQPGDRPAARTELVERAAYSWINRLLALRAMESRGLIDETLRANPDYEGLPESLYVLRQSEPGRASGADAGWWAVIEDACGAQAAGLPGLFDLNDPATALRPSTPALLRCMSLIGQPPVGFTLKESDAAFADPDAIGWAYQFYQEAAKAAVYAKLGSGGKAETRAEISAATQLFTEPYMVKWLLQNSLGRSYHELHPDSALPFTWEYYIRPETLGKPSVLDLSMLTVMDPCAGSGHFLREAFDMLVAMYGERRPELKASEIADTILARHLHGIDIDPRAAQLAALTLYLRAWELVREERRRERRPGGAPYRPPAMSLAATPTGIGPGSLQRHLRRHPGDRVMKPMLEAVFTSLEQADILGSLLRPSEYLDEAIKALRQPHTMRMDFDADEAELRWTITRVANQDPGELKRMLLDRIEASFRAEAGDSDVAASLFGREAEEGVRLLRLLDHKYAVVVTNPPYMRNGSMDTTLKSYLQQNYSSGKSDLFAAFVLRCAQLCQQDGRVAMVTMESWLFLRSFTELRAIPENKLKEAYRKRGHLGMLREYTFEVVAQLGAGAFEEITGEVVKAVLFVVLVSSPSPQRSMTALRLLAFNSPAAKASTLRQLSSNAIPGCKFSIPQSSLLRLPNSPVAYWVPQAVLSWMASAPAIGDVAQTTDGVTGLSRLTRFFWEVPTNLRWNTYSKGGPHVRWAGLETHVIDWHHSGARQRAYIDHYYSYMAGNYSFRLKPPGILPPEVFVFSSFGKGGLGCRVPSSPTIVGDKGPGVVPRHDYPSHLLGWLNHRGLNFLMRAIGGQGQVQYPYLADMPIIPLERSVALQVENLQILCLGIKRTLVSKNLTESIFVPQCWRPESSSSSAPTIETETQILSGLLSQCESIIETLLFSSYPVDEHARHQIIEETGMPAGWHPLISGYDTIPELPVGLILASLPQVLIDHFASHERITPAVGQVNRIRTILRALYEAGPGTRDSDRDEDSDTTVDEGDESVSSGHVPIPTETFLEELSVKLRIHPISVYWLLEELRSEGVRCKPEERRLLEDRLSVLVLRLLGHRWPRQIEAGEPVPEWADHDGIIPLVAGTGQPTLAERLRERLRAEDGEAGAQRTEALLEELTGARLDDWLRRQFYPRHVRQFKSRPIAWHLASALQGGGRRRGARLPAFECLLYYHKCGRDALASIRTRYVEPLLLAERRRADEARRNNDDTAAAIATDRIHELEDFARRLGQVEEAGFASPDLDKLLAAEPLDRWSGDGYFAPASRDELAHAERSLRVDINDGVRVNIAPLQLAGLLAGDVLKAADARKAIADRARWRADERRWVREGKLPRCGWMDESVPESSNWTKLAPQRDEEQMKLERKRAEALAALGQTEVLHGAGKRTSN